MFVNSIEPLPNEDVHCIEISKYLYLSTFSRKMSGAALQLCSHTKNIDMHCLNTVYFIRQFCRHTYNFKYIWIRTQLQYAFRSIDAVMVAREIAYKEIICVSLHRTLTMCVLCVNVFVIAYQTSPFLRATGMSSPDWLRGKSIVSQDSNCGHLKEKGSRTEVIGRRGCRRRRAAVFTSLC